MTEGIKPPAAALPWLVETARVTAFCAVPVGSLRAWWDQVTEGTVPENINESPRTGAAGIRGSWRSGNLTLGTDGGRVDWVYASREEEELAPWPSLGSMKELEAFSNQLNAWLGKANLDYRRLALGAILRHPVVDRKAGYVALEPLLRSVRIDADRMSELHYQINWRRQSTVVPDLEINRLMKWSVARTQRVQLQIQPMGTPTPIGPERLAAKLEVDINTSPEHVGSLPQAGQVFAELVKLGFEIATEGESP